MEKIKPSKKWSKLDYYIEQSGDWMFSCLQDKQYISANVKISFKPKWIDLWVLYDIMPGNKEFSRQWAKWYSIVTTIGEDELDWSLDFVLVNATNLSTKNEQKEIYIEGVTTIPEEYRWWDVVLNMYEMLIDFAKKNDVKEIHSDSILSKWWVSLYKRLIDKGYKIGENNKNTINEKGAIFTDDRAAYVIFL